MQDLAELAKDKLPFRVIQKKPRYTSAGPIKPVVLDYSSAQTYDSEMLQDYQSTRVKCEKPELTEEERSRPVFKIKRNPRFQLLRTQLSEMLVKNENVEKEGRKSGKTLIAYPKEKRSRSSDRSSKNKW